MAKKRAKSQPQVVPGPVLPPAPPPQKVRSLVWLRVLFSVMVVSACVVLVTWLGKLASQQLGQRHRYRVPLDSVQFDFPSHLNRHSFLAEVRYVSGLQDSIDTADQNISTVLKAAFEKHPWVEHFDCVEVQATGEVRLQIHFRAPQLAILWRRDGENETRALDHLGVLLPPNANTTNLPLLLNERGVHLVEAGQVWPEAEVLRAVQLSKSYSVRTISRTKLGWSLVETSGKTLTIYTP